MIYLNFKLNIVKKVEGKIRRDGEVELSFEIKKEDKIWQLTNKALNSTIKFIKSSIGKLVDDNLDTELNDKIIFNHKLNF